MVMTRIRLGLMAYINTLPVDWGLIQGDFAELVTIRRGTPTTLNRLLAEGELDVSPVSSVAAAEHAADWLVFDHLCIGSRGAVGSVILHSDVPVEELGGRSITVTAQSATAAKLLEVLLTRHWRVKAKLILDDGEVEATPNKGLAIGREKSSPALHAKGFLSFPLDRSHRQRARSNGNRIEVLGESCGEALFTKKASPQHYSLPRLLIGDPALKTAQSNPSGFIYDLGQAWRDYSGYGFVFGLWCVRREFAEKHPRETNLLYDLLRASRGRGLEEKAKVVAEAARVTGLSESRIISYFNKLDYDLDAELWKGLSHFLHLSGYDPDMLQCFGGTEQWTERLGASGGS